MNSSGVNSLLKKVKGFEVNQKAANYAHNFFKLDVSNLYFLELNFHDEKEKVLAPPLWAQGRFPRVDTFNFLNDVLGKIGI